jgi:alkanesulfonate monooxygenase SsuD/methylene tetrahydromethanopterin reductase-like flavin-dependent oxidoreductase (luciferase family)
MDSLWQNYGERAAVEARLGAAIVGSKATVQAGLKKLVSETGADEIIVVTDTYEPADRFHSYQRVAEVAALNETKATVAVGN